MEYIYNLGKIKKKLIYRNEWFYNCVNNININWMEGFLKVKFKYDFYKLYKKF